MKYRKNSFIEKSEVPMTDDESVFFDIYTNPSTLEEFSKNIVLKKDVRKILDLHMKSGMLSGGGFLSKVMSKIAPPDYDVPLNNQSFNYVLSTVESMKEENILVSEEELISKIPVAKEKTADRKINYVCVSTANRPEQLKIFLEECRKIQSEDNSLSIIVSDGSLDINKSKGNKEVMLEMKKHFSELYYIDNNKRKDVSKILSEKISVPVEDVSYGLLESSDYYSGGTAKNFIILATAGNNILMVDDDVVLSDVRVFGDSDKESVGYVSEFSLHQKKYESLDEIGGNKSTKSIMELSESVIGKGLNEVILNKEIKILDTSDRLLKSSNNNKGAIKMSTLGHFGHSAMWSQDAFLRLNYKEESHPSHFSDEEYLKNKNYDFISNVAKTDLIYDGNSFVSLNFALDNTSISPFFEPVGRSEDSIFVSLLNGIHKDYYQYIFKESVQHKRPETWDILYDVKSRLSPDNIICILIYESLQKIEMNSLSIESVYEKSGEYIEEITELDLEKFEEKIHDIFKGLIDAIYFDVGFALYLNKNTNKEWRKDMEKDLQDLISAKKEKMDIRYYGQKESMPITEIQKMLKSFGKFQKNWPKLWETSKDLDISFFAEKI